MTRTLQLSVTLFKSLEPFAASTVPALEICKECSKIPQMSDKNWFVTITLFIEIIMFCFYAGKFLFYFIDPVPRQADASIEKECLS